MEDQFLFFSLSQGHKDTVDRLVRTSDRRRENQPKFQAFDLESLDSRKNCGSPFKWMRHVTQERLFVTLVI